MYDIQYICTFLYFQRFSGVGQGPQYVTFIGNM